MLLWKIGQQRRAWLGTVSETGTTKLPLSLDRKLGLRWAAACICPDASFLLPWRRGSVATASNLPFVVLLTQRCWGEGQCVRTLRSLCLSFCSSARYHTSKLFCVLSTKNGKLSNTRDWMSGQSHCIVNLFFNQISTDRNFDCILCRQTSCTAAYV